MKTAISNILSERRLSLIEWIDFESIGIIYKLWESSVANIIQYQQIQVCLDERHEKTIIAGNELAQHLLNQLPFSDSEIDHYKCLFDDLNIPPDFWHYLSTIRIDIPYRSAANRTLIQDRKLVAYLTAPWAMTILWSNIIERVFSEIQGYVTGYHERVQRLKPSVVIPSTIGGSISLSELLIIHEGAKLAGAHMITDIDLDSISIQIPMPLHSIKEEIKFKYDDYTSYFMEQGFRHIIAAQLISGY